MRYAINHRFRRVTDKILGDIQARVDAKKPELRRIERGEDWEHAPGMRPLPEEEDTRPIRVPILARGTRRDRGAVRVNEHGETVVQVNAPLTCACGEPKNFWEAQCGLCAA